MKSTPTLVDAYRAASRIRSTILQTPLTEAPDLARQSGARSVHLKLESLQPTGSFKIRGAANKILSLDDSAKKNGVITFSTGNHGKAVAYVAARNGIRATVCLSEHVPAYRADTIRTLGAEVSVKGRSQDEAEAHYRDLTLAHNLTPVVPFDDPLIVSGQATISLEILSRLPDTDVLLVPLSGGGLLAGMAMAAKAINPDIQVVGVSLERSPAMVESLKAGRPVQIEEKHTLADSLLGGIGFDNRFTLPMVAKYVDDHVLIGEAEIEKGMFFLFETHRTIAEGAGAVGIGALQNRLIDVSGKRVVAVVTGGSIDSSVYLSIIAKQRERNPDS
jgi:threonine dehydratase